MRADGEKTVVVVAGEESGDTLGAELGRALRAATEEGSTSLRLVGLGGPQMAAAGYEMHRDMMDLAVMGFVRVLRRLPTFLRLLDETEAWLADLRPDLLVLVDYPGFNLRLAARARELDIPVVYYVSPQVWAWRRGRARKIARLVDRMLCLFPFEVPIYRRLGLRADCVGHPIFDAIEAHEPDPAFAERHGPDPSDEVIGILPGSREQDIRGTLPTMLGAVERIEAVRPGGRWLLPYPREELRPVIDEILDGSGVEIVPVPGAVREVLCRARAALVASGTATLETMAFGVPMVVVYKTSPFLILPARLLLRTPERAIALVNVLAGRRIVPEHLIWRDDPDPVARDLLPFLVPGEERSRVLADLRALRERVAEPGASRRAARAILDELGIDESVPSPAPGATLGASPETP